MGKHLNVLSSVIHKIDPKLVVECTGSYRRGEHHCKDIDLMVTHPQYKTQDDTYSTNLLNDIADALTKNGYLVDIIGSGSHQIIGVVKLSGTYPHRKFEIKVYPMENFYTGLLHFTGPAEFNRQMRRIAKLKGYKLSEYFLAPRHSLIMNRKSSRDYKLGHAVHLNSEKDIFDILGLPYRKPEERSLNF